LASGIRTKIHDHTSWGAYCCAVGSVLEERYERLDDGSRLNHARLKKVWQLSWSRDDGASTVLPYDEGIHRMGNPAEEVAIGVHLYGSRLGSWVEGTTTPPVTTFVIESMTLRAVSQTRVKKEGGEAIMSGAENKAKRLRQ
jgi:hypothetical protein